MPQYRHSVRYWPNNTFVATFIGTAVDNRQWQGGLTAVLNHERWNTSVGLGSGAYTDRAQPDFSTRSRTLSWGAYLQAGLASHEATAPSLNRVLRPQVEGVRAGVVADGVRRVPIVLRGDLAVAADAK